MELHRPAACPVERQNGQVILGQILSTLTGKVAYSYEGDIYVMNADGSAITRLTTDPAMDFDPAWSPDGIHIAFRSHRDGDEEVYLMNAEGSDDTVPR
jgi:Tol biopolymer transport system component